MSSWNEYLKDLLANQTVVNDLVLQYNGKAIFGSSIVEASILIHEDIVQNNEINNVFVFPEINELLYEFVLSKIIYDIEIGSIGSNYNPHTFTHGQKLKYKNCVFKFDKCEYDENGIERIYIKFDDKYKTLYSVPVDIAPLFQTVEENVRRVSTYEAFSRVYNAQKARQELSSFNKKEISVKLSDYQTHLSKSIFLITNVGSAIEYFRQTTINGKPLIETLLIGKVNKEGKICNCFPGQLSGNPAIVLASDLYSINSALLNGLQAHTIVINSSQNYVIDNNLDQLDELSNNNIPILLLTDIKNSFNLNEIMNRGYNVWRWNADSLVESVQKSTHDTVKRIICNCATQSISYLNISCSETNEVLKLIYSHKTEVETLSANIISVYNKLFNLLFVLLRTAVPFQPGNISHIQNLLDDCEQLLNQGRRFISNDLYDDLMKVISNFKKVFVVDFPNQKVGKIAEIISSNKYSSLCIVITERLDKVSCEGYWKNYVEETNGSVNIKVVYPQEYQSICATQYDATIIVGWLNDKNMRNVIYSFGTKEYIVLTYDCEEKWRKYHTRIWNRTLSNNSNIRIVENTLNKKSRDPISDNIFTVVSDVSQDDSSDELADIENLIQTNRCRQYGVSSVNGACGEIIDAYPVSFVGGYLSFYRCGHKVITVTDIVASENDDIVLKTPEELVVGDFVVVREADRDIIKDIADRILENSGKPNLRSVALRWKEALKVETMFSTTEDIFETLKLRGCTKGYPTVRNWIENEDQFSLKDLDDIVCIAKAVDDAFLLETAGSVFSAGCEVKSAHIQAGQYLSRLLKRQIGEALLKKGNIDIFNIWEPLELQLEDIGTVIILKIIDINRPIQVDSSNTNKLISE